MDQPQSDPERSAVKVYSFDIFDTCITRMHAFPRDLFYDLGLHLAPKSINESARHLFARRFQRARIRAEKIANWRARRAGNEHADIFSIYHHIHWLMHLGQSSEDLVAAELALEEESLYPIEETMAHIRKLREQGHRIIFISDMYIPARLLEPLLQRKGVMQQDDTLYVSCDMKASKHSGRLFQYVLQAEDLPGPELVHTGDNAHADIHMAQALGIRTQHLTVAHLTEREAAIAGTHLPRRRANSFLPALTRRLRLSGSDTFSREDEPLEQIIYGTIVPFLLIYVIWVLNHAKKQGIRRLYFVARDAEVMLRIAQALQGENGSIELRYLFGSRRAWIGPSADPNSTDWQHPLILPGQVSSRHDITSRMGLDESTRKTLRKMMSCNKAEWSAYLSQDQAREFLSDLMDYTPAAELALSCLARERNTVLHYFRQEGMLDNVPWALVDAGWSLNSQAALKRILDSTCNMHQTPKGYYLALARDHLSEAQAGASYPFITRTGSIFARRRVIIEHCFLPSMHATTLGYRMEGTRAKPNFGPELRGEEELSYATKLQEAAVSAARLAATDPKVSTALSEHAAALLTNAENLLRHPSADEARAMAMFSTVADMRHEASFVEPLCRILGPRDILTIVSMSLSKKRSFKTPSFMWLEGSIALSPWYVRMPLKLVLLADSIKNGMLGGLLGIKGKRHEKWGVRP